MEPLYSWGAFVCIGGAVFLYYMKDSKYAMKAKESVTSSTSSAKQSMTLGVKRKQNKDSSRKREVKSTPSSDARSEPSTNAEATSTSSTVNPASGNTKKRKAGKTPVSPAVPVVETQEAEAVEDNDDGQWAAQLAAARKGVALNKQSGGPSSNEVSRSQSRTESPSAQIGVRTAGAVDDMLEPRAAGPSSLRITGGEENKQKPKVAKKEEQVETKKQRQNRKKKEAEGAQRAADEKERKVLAEKQRRMARESRGEAAKDGSSFKAPNSSVWTSGSQANGINGQSAPSTAAPVQMLDTYEQDGASTTSSNEANTNTATPATATSTLEDYPTEEAQMAAIQEQVGWNEVQTKKQKKKGNKASTPDSPPSEAGSKGSNGYGNLSAGDLIDGTSEATTPVAKQPPIMKPEPKQKQPAPQPQPKQSNPVSNSNNLYAALNGGPGHPGDSDWAA